MALDKPNIVDAIGIETDTGLAVLTIADSWDWENQQEHLLALEAKLNAYFNFVESGQMRESYPDAVGRRVAIDVIGRFPIPDAGLRLLKRAAEVCKDKGIQIRNRHYPGSKGPSENEST